LHPATTPAAAADQVGVTDDPRSVVEVIPLPGAPGPLWEWNGVDWCSGACSTTASAASPAR
jgi:hypothetical protein